MRALVSIFAGLLIVISLYQLSFTWFVNKHEAAMTQKAERFVKNNFPSAATKYPGNKDAQVLYQDSLSLVVRARTEKTAGFYQRNQDYLVGNHLPEIQRK